MQAPTAISHGRMPGSSAAWGMETTMHDTLTRSRLQTGAHHLHTLGPGAVAAFIEDLAERIGGLPAAVGLLAEYSLVSPQPRRNRKRVTSVRAANDARWHA